jgi:hypothetical protein
MAGVSQPSPLTPARQRAQALARSGDRPGAIALLEHAVGLGRVNLGEDDPDVLAAAHQLARVYIEADDPAAARRVLEEAYAAGQWRLGDADPLLLEISYDLGVVAEELGNRHEARKALARVVEAGQPVLGDFHWAVVKARAYLDGDTGALRSPPVPTQQQAGPPVVAPSPDRPPLKQRIPQQSAPPVGDPATQRPPSHPPRPEQERPPGRRAGPEHERPPSRSARLEEERPPSRPARPDPEWPEQERPVGHATMLPVPHTPMPMPMPDRPVRQPLQHLPAVDQPTVAHPVVHPRLPEYQPPLPPVHRPAEERLDPPPRPEPRDPAYGSGPAYARRGPAVFAAIAAVLAAIIAVAALVFVLADRGDDRDRPDVPTLGGGPPPSDVRVDDFGTSVTVSWTDPGQGRTSFIVTGGHPGEVLRSMGTVGPGQTRFTLQGLNDQLDYCFAVLAVYSTTEFASSPQSCTSRPDPRPSG